MSQPQNLHRAAATPEALKGVQQTDTVHHDAGKKHKAERGAPQLNITSMLDVCFQLLIFFILTTNFAVGEGILPADLPVGQGKASSAKPPEQPITITLNALGDDAVSIQIEGYTATNNFAELFKSLQTLQNSPQNPTGPYNADDPVIIKPQPIVAWHHVVNCFNAAVRAKYTNVSFAQPNKG
jgi:biopolymer transport protein ExbD